MFIKKIIISDITSESILMFFEVFLKPSRINRNKS